MQWRLCASGYFSCLISFYDSPLGLDKTLPLNLPVSGQPSTSITSFPLCGWPKRWLVWLLVIFSKIALLPQCKRNSIELKFEIEDRRDRSKTAPWLLKILWARSSDISHWGYIDFCKALSIHIYPIEQEEIEALLSSCKTLRSLEKKTETILLRMYPSHFHLLNEPCSFSVEMAELLGQRLFLYSTFV